MSTPTPRFDTAQLGPLRSVIARLPALQACIGNIVQFRLVVDANFVIQELIHRIRRPDHGPSAFEELIKATVIDVYAPRWLDMEMVTAIPKAAKRSKVSEAELHSKWMQFRTLLKWDETLCEPGPPSGSVCDPKDLPYVLLEQKLNADGILTKDAHIARLGGHPLTLDFVFTTRNYARSAVTNVSIRVMGVVVPTVAVMAVVELLRRIAHGFGALPNPAKALLVVVGAIALLYPTSRKWIMNRCVDTYKLMQPPMDELMQIAGTLAATSAVAEAQASLHLQEATRVIRLKRSVVVASPRVRRRRARRSSRSTSPVAEST